MKLKVNLPGSLVGGGIVGAGVGGIVGAGVVVVSMNVIM